MAGNRNSPCPGTAEALERLGRSSLHDLSMEGLLQTVADLTGTVVRARTETSVTLLVEDDEQVTGALDVHARVPHAFDEDSRSAATELARYAAVAADLVHTGQLPRA